MADEGIERVVAGTETIGLIGTGDYVFLRENQSWDPQGSSSCLCRIFKESDCAKVSIIPGKAAAGRSSSRVRLTNCSSN